MSTTKGPSINAYAAVILPEEMPELTIPCVVIGINEQHAAHNLHEIAKKNGVTEYQYSLQLLDRDMVRKIVEFLDKDEEGENDTSA